MKAFVIDKPGEYSFSERDKPSVKEGEILLRIKRVGYCGSDLNTFRGKNPLVAYPRIPGHEIGAYIEKLGDNVPSNYKKGDLVTILPYTNCGSCGSCLQGRFNACEKNQTMGVQQEGSMTEFITIPHEKVLVIKHDDPNLAALIEPLSIGFHAAGRGNPQKGETVLVFGCGMVGIGVMLKAKRCGAKVIAVDVDDKKLALVKKFGVDETINSLKENLEEKVSSLTGGQGPRLVIEAVGLDSTYVKAIELVSYAGRVVYVGYAKSPVTYDTKLFLLKEMDIRGSRNSGREDFEDVIRMIEENQFDVRDLITKVVPFDEAGIELAKWDADPGSVTKLILDI